MARTAKLHGTSATNFWSTSPWTYRNGSLLPHPSSNVSQSNWIPFASNRINWSRATRHFERYPTSSGMPAAGHCSRFIAHDWSRSPSRWTQPVNRLAFVANYEGLPSQPQGPQGG